MTDTTGGESISIRTCDREEWPAVAARFADYNYEQSPDYAHAMAARSGSSVRFLTVTRGDSLLGAASVRIKALPFVGRGLAYISGGPMTKMCSVHGDDDRTGTVLAALRQHLVEESRHTLFVRLPVACDRESGSDMVVAQAGFQPTQRVRSYRTVLVDLEPEVGSLRNRLAGKWRTDLNFATKAGLIVERGSSQRFCGRFLGLFAEMHQVKNFELGADPRVFLGLPPQHSGLEIFIATKNGKDAAGHVISLLGDTAVYVFGATNEVGRKTKAGYLLNWHAIILAKEQGLTCYDLGGIDPEANPDGYRFKKRMGGTEVSAPGPYEARPDGAVSAVIDNLLQLRRQLQRR